MTRRDFPALLPSLRGRLEHLQRQNHDGHAPPEQATGLPSKKEVLFFPQQTYFLFCIRFYSFIHETRRERQRHRRREKQTPCSEPDVGLDPRTPGSCSEPKVDAQPLSHPGAPQQTYFKMGGHSILKEAQVWHPAQHLQDNNTGYYSTKTPDLEPTLSVRK